MGTKITLTENGPAVVETDALEVCDHAGKAVDTGGKTKVFLCRCGGSSNKPFCDGSHRKNGFTDPR